MSPRLHEPCAEEAGPRTALAGACGCGLGTACTGSRSCHPAPSSVSFRARHTLLCLGSSRRTLPEGRAVRHPTLPVGPVCVRVQETKCACFSLGAAGPPRRSRSHTPTLPSHPMSAYVRYPWYEKGTGWVLPGVSSRSETAPGFSLFPPGSSTPTQGVRQWPGLALVRRAAGASWIIVLKPKRPDGSLLPSRLEASSFRRAEGRPLPPSHTVEEASVRALSGASSVFVRASDPYRTGLGW